MKRYISLLLTAAMLLSLLIVPASAEGTPEMELQVLSFTENLGAIVEGQPLNSAKPEDLLAVKVLFNNKTENTINFGGYAIQIEYDKDLFTPYSYNYEEEGFTSTAGPVIYSKLIQRFANESNAKKEGLCEWTGGIASPLPIDTNKTLVLGYALFKVKADVESTTTEFKFSNNSEKNFIASSKPEQGGVSDVDYVKGVSFNAVASLTINGVAPELDYVEVTDATNTVLAYSKSETEKYAVEKRADEVTLDSKTSYTYYVKAYSKKGTDITNQVQWSISHDRPETVGAQLDETGKENKVVKVTIPEKGGSPNGVTLSEITAKMPEAAAGKTAKILYRRANSIPTSADISLCKGSSASLQVPGTDAADVTAQFDAVVYDQFGEDITRTALGFSCKWYVERANAGNTSTPGISMNYSTGLLTVKSDALSTVQNGNTSYTVYIQADQASGGKRVGTYPITVSLSDRAPAKIEITGAGSIDIPITGEKEKKELYTATVKDQYGAEMSGQTVTWSVVDGNGYAQNPVGVNLNESTGALTVTSAAAGNTFAPPEGTKKIYYIQATCGGATERTSFTLTRETAKVTKLEITGPDTLEVPTKGSPQDGQITPYPVTIYDQYGVEMNSNGYSFGRELATTGVSDVIFQPDGVKVTCYAAGNQFDQNNALTFTIKASCVGKEATKTITLTRQPSVATAITYNDTVITVVPTDDAQVPTKAAPAVEDQYGLLMNNATVEQNGALPAGIVLKNGELYITKAAKTHFGGERRDEVQVFVNLKCGESAKNTVKLKLKLAAAQINKDSAEITGSANIAKPTGSTANTAVYSISDLVDQYRLPMKNVDRSKLSLKLYSDQACVTEVTGAPVTLSGNTITVTSGAVENTKYYLKAKYSDIQCAPVKEITIVDKTVSNTLTVTQGDFTYGEEGKLNPVVKKGSETITNATFVYTKDGQTVTKIKDAGTYTVTATCEDANYIYTGSAQFEIKPKALTDMLTINSTNLVYNGQNQSPVYEVKDGTAALNANAHYDVTSGSTGKDAGAYTLRITGKGNYTGTVEKAWSIEKATLTVTGAAIPAINYDPSFNGALTVNSVTFSGLMNGETLAKGTDYTVSGFTNAKNAGTHQGEAEITVTLNENGTAKNYKFATALLDGRRVVVSGDVTISKIDHRAEAVSAEGKYGNQLAMDLAQYLEGGSATVDTITDNENILDAVEGGAKAIVQNGKLWLQLTGDPTKVSKSAQVTLTVNSTNYNPFTITVTVTVQNKETQTVTASDLNVTYGDAGVKLNASALGNAKLTYQVTEGADVVAVDTNGNVTLRKSGTAKIQITAVETEDYGTANTTVTVTVAKRSLTVKADDLTAYVGGQLPALDYTVTGLVSGDTLTVPELELKGVPAGVDPMKTAGTYTIGFKTAPVADPDKYDLTVEPGTLTVSSRPNVNPVPAGNSVKLEEAAGGKITSSVSRATKGTTVTITVKPDAGYQLEELEVLDKNGEALPLKELANGKFSFQMPDSKVTVQASFVQESTYAGYPDVLPQDWFYSAVRYVTERGLMNGTPNGFEPNMDSSRATIWTILARFSGVDTTVVSGEWYAVARQWAMENGVSDGTNPNGVITREQLATMLYRFAKNKGLVQEPVTADLSVFVDAGQISDYALDAMRWAVSVGLLNGMDGSRLAPQGSAARAQVAAMLMRFDQLAK